MLLPHKQDWISVKKSSWLCRHPSLYSLSHTYLTQSPQSGYLTCAAARLSKLGLFRCVRQVSRQMHSLRRTCQTEKHTFLPAVSLTTTTSLYLSLGAVAAASERKHAMHTLSLQKNPQAFAFQSQPLPFPCLIFCWFEAVHRQYLLPLIKPPGRTLGISGRKI